MIGRRRLLGALATVPLAAVPARAEEPHQETQRLRTDWAWLGRYAENNRRLLASGEKIGIVFLGDSITEGWRDKRPGFFTPGRVNRGIGGQTTPQMLVRFMADVVALKPRVVHIMAGTNDIAGNTGPMTPDQTQANLVAMAQLARANGIRVLLASVPPAANFPWQLGLDTMRPIRALNAWAADWAGRHDAAFVDYTPALADANGGMRAGLAYDGVHPTAAGYDAMAGVLEPILRSLEL